VKYNNRVKKIANVPKSLVKFNEIIKKKYDDFDEGKDTYQLTYLDEENEQIDISDDEDYEVFLQSSKNMSGGSVKVFLNKKEGGHKFDKEIDDCQTVHESVLGDTMLGSSAINNFELNPFAIDYSKIEEYKRKIEFLKAERDQALLETELFKLKNQLKGEDKKKIKSKKKELKKEMKKTKKAAKKAKKTKTSKTFKEDTTKGQFKEDIELNVDLKEPEVQISVEMVPDCSSSDLSIQNEPLPVKIEIDEKVESPREIKLQESKEENANDSIDEAAKKQSDFDFSSDNEDKKLESSDIVVDIPSPAELAYPNPSIIIDNRPGSFTDDRHQYAIQPVLKRKISEKSQSKCCECSRSLDNDTKLICSICEDYNLCEACEIRTAHEHVFIKIPNGVEFNLEVYDKFCQKMLGLHTGPPTENKHQAAIMNPQVQKENIKIASMMQKRAQILTKDKYAEGIPANRGESVSLSWDVKNMTNQPWTKNMIIAVSNTSDLMMNEQRIDLQLGSNEKGTVEVNFIMPQELNGLKELKLSMYLFDLENQKPIGEIFYAKLIAYK